MSTGLYEELGISSDATPEQVRKAYKQKALLTHPDRLPQGSTPEQKAISEEKFRKVNNAYEVLIDPKKREGYDIHGIWPPPEESPSPHWSTKSQHGSYYGGRPTRSYTFPDPFFHNSPLRGFNFTDPFALFDQIFEGTPFARSSRRHHPFFSQPLDPFDRMHSDIDGIMDELDRDPFGTRTFPGFGLLSPMPVFPAIASSSFSSSSFGNSTGRGRWVSESFSSRAVNGVQESIRRRIDTEGNEHITRTLPDGRKIRTINGIEQPPQGHNRYLPESQTNHYLPPPLPPLPPTQVVQSTPRPAYEAPPPPPYLGAPPQVYHDRPRDHHEHPRHRNRNKKYHTSDYGPEQHEEVHHHKRWWPTGRH